MTMTRDAMTMTRDAMIMTRIDAVTMTRVDAMTITRVVAMTMTRVGMTMNRVDAMTRVIALVYDQSCYDQSNENLLSYSTIASSQEQRDFMPKLPFGIG